MTTATIILLPELPGSSDRAMHWWAVVDGAVVNRGVGEEWLDALGTAGAGADGRLIALAPATAVRCVVAPAATATQRQALGVARSAALVDGLADPATLHAVASMVVDHPEAAERTTITAIVANSSMLEWLDWLEGLGADPLAIVPVAMLLPVSPDWSSAKIGSDRLLARAGRVIPDEPAFRSALVGTDEVTIVPQDEIETSIAALDLTIPLNLRSGPFARRRLFTIDRARLRELALLALLIPLVGLLIAVVTIVRLNGNSRALERETATLVSEGIGRQVAADGVEAALNARFAERAGASGSPFTPLSAIYQQLQLVPAVGADALAWQADGTLSVTLAAPRTDDLNRVLMGLQAAGYRITAVPRQASDGRAMTDITVRSAP